MHTSNFNKTKDLIANQALKVTSTAKVFFYHKIALDVQLINFLLEKITFRSRDIYIFALKSTGFKIYDVIIGIAT